VPAISQLCMNCALTGEWEAAYRYAVQAIALRKISDAALIPLDFSSQYGTESLLLIPPRSKRKRKCSDWGNVWDPTGACACPTCRRRLCLPRGRERANRPSATCARQQSWPQPWACRANAGRSRRRWAGYMRQPAILCKRARLLRRQRPSSGSWQRASRMRPCVRAFWLGHRFNRCLGNALATAHNAAHNVFMALPPYTSIREGAARQLGVAPNLAKVGLAVRNTLS